MYVDLMSLRVVNSTSSVLDTISINILLYLSICIQIYIKSFISSMSSGVYTFNCEKFTNEDSYAWSIVKKHCQYLKSPCSSYSVHFKNTYKLDVQNSYKSIKR